MGRALALFGSVAWLVAIGLVAVAVHSSGRPHLVPPLATAATSSSPIGASSGHGLVATQNW